MIRFHRLLPRTADLLRDRQGVAATEFALILPVLMVLLLGVAEIGQKLLVNDRLGAAASRIADLVTQETSLSPAKLSTILAAAPTLTGHSTFGDNGVVIVSAITGDRHGNARVAWQQRDHGRLDTGSRIGVSGALADLPHQVSVGSGETVIAVEVFHLSRGFFESLGSSRPTGCDDAADACTYRTAFFHGRISDLAELTRD